MRGHPTAHAHQPVLDVDEAADARRRLGGLATNLAGQLGDPGSADLGALCSELGAITGARLVTLRRIDHGYSTFVAGWSAHGGLTTGPPIATVGASILPAKPIRSRDPVYLLPEPAESMIGIFDDPVSARLPRVVVPAVTEHAITGYLHFTLPDGNTLLASQASLDIVSVLAVLAIQIDQIREHTADRDARMAVEGMLRTTALRFLRLAPGEEDEAIPAALEELGRSTATTHLTYWDIDSTTGSTRRVHGWTADGSNVREILSDDPTAPNAAVSAFRSLEETSNVSTLCEAGAGEAVIDLARHEILSAIVTPCRLGSTVRGAIVAARSAERPWLDWEIAALETFGALIPQIQARMVTESQIAASFYDAPVGITVENNNRGLVDCNQAFLDLIGVDHERELLGRTHLELLATEEITDAVFDALIEPAGNGLRRLEVPYRHADGSVVWGRMSSTPIPAPVGVGWLTHVEDVTAARAERQRDRERATRDALTGLPNRHELIDALAARGDDPFTLMMLDLNGFKAINDRHGHLVGDELLQELGSRLRDRVRRGDLIWRFGGDEFVAILSGVRDPDVIAAQERRLRAAITSPVITSAGQVQVGVSIGIATRSEEESSEEVLARADAAMYAKKSPGQRTGTPLLT